MTASQQPPQEHAANAGVSMEDLFRGIEPIRSADVFTRDAAALFDVTL